MAIPEPASIAVPAQLVYDTLVQIRVLEEICNTLGEDPSGEEGGPERAFADLYHVAYGRMYFDRSDDDEEDMTPPFRRIVDEGSRLANLYLSDGLTEEAMSDG